MTRTLSSLALCAGLALPLAAQAADLAGAWVVHADFGPKLRYDLLCALKQEGAAVSGPCMATFGYPLRASASIDGDQLQVQYLTDYQGMDVPVTYTGARESSGNFRGKVQAGPTVGAFDGGPFGDHSGGWLFDVRLAGFPDFQLFCAFKGQGHTVRGPCSVVVGSPLRASGTADGKGLELAYDTELAGAKIHVVYSGPVGPDGSWKGQASGGGATGAFTAKRR